MKEIVKAITPQHIYDIPLLKDGLDIFISFLMENSDITEDIKKIYDSSKKPIYEEWLKIYINNIYKMLTKGASNGVLYNKMQKLYKLAGHDISEIEPDMTIDSTSLLTKDYLYTNKDFKSSKGTAKAIEYIYNIIIKSGIQKDFLDGNDYSFAFRDAERLFEYEVQGNMITEIFEYYVKPLTHPLGWSHIYKHIIYLSFTDYFDIIFTLDVRAVEVRCMNGDALSTDNYVTNVSHNNKPLVQDNKINSINSEEIVTGLNSTSTRRTVYFKSGETLVSNEIPRSLILYNADGSIKINYNDFNGNCGLFLDYDVKNKTSVLDSIAFSMQTPLASTTGKLNAIGAGNVFIGDFVIGDKLVNKNIPVTYKTYVGGYHSKTNTRDLISVDWDDNKNNWDNFTFDDYIVVNTADSLVDVEWDNNKYEWDNFIFDDSVVLDNISKFNLNGFDGTDMVQIFSIGAEKGATMIDEFEMNQIPIHQDNVVFNFTDSVTFSDEFEIVTKKL